MMKKITTIFICMWGLGVYAQLAISTNSIDHEPHPNAILDVKSTSPAKAVLLPTVPQINAAVDPNNDDSFKGAIVYSKNNASIYEHDGNNWRSVYEYITETKPQYLAHFSRPLDFVLACSATFPNPGCSNEGVIPISSSGTSDFIGPLINLSVASNTITVNETGLYRITYRSYATFNNLTTREIQLRLQKANAATPGTFTTIDSKLFTSDNNRLGYNPVFNGSIVTQVNAGDKFRLTGFMQSILSIIRNSSVTFLNNDTYGTGEFIFEKIVL